LFARSQDEFLGTPFNIASYALLTYMIAHICDLQPKELVISATDVHIYSNHVEQVKEQLKREPYPAPTLRFARTITDIDDFKFEDFILENYKCHGSIKAPMAV
jgi:thymidylate synthase